jgi:ADP-ribose pyrophosphatase
MSVQFVPKAGQPAIPPIDETMLKETLLANKQVFTGRVFDLHVQEVHLSNGRVTHREVIIHPGAVAIVAFWSADHILLVRQYRRAIEQITWEVPAGTLENDEDLAEAARRELREETGYNARYIEFVGAVVVAPGYTSEKVHLCIARDLFPDPKAADSDEFLNTYHVRLVDVMAMVANGDIFDAKTICALVMATQFKAG